MVAGAGAAEARTQGGGAPGKIAAGVIVHDGDAGFGLAGTSTRSLRRGAAGYLSFRAWVVPGTFFGISVTLELVECV